MKKMNCLESCVAFIVGISVSDLPPISDEDREIGLSITEYFDYIEPFLRERGFEAQMVPMDRGVSPRDRVIQIQKNDDLGEYLHAVVEDNGDVIFDLCPSYQGCTQGWIRLVRLEKNE